MHDHDHTSTPPDDPFEYQQYLLERSRALKEESERLGEISRTLRADSEIANRFTPR